MRSFSNVAGFSLLCAVWMGLCGGCAGSKNAASDGSATHAAAHQDMAKSAPAEKRDFVVDGYYVEACSCAPPCPCELTGAEMGCNGVGGYQFNHATYGGEDFSGTRMAYTLNLGESVHVYLDAPDAAKRATLEKFARAALAGFGPIKGVHEARIEIAGHDGAYTLRVDNGRVVQCVTEPVLGGDHTTAISHHNTQDALNPVMYQGTCVSCTYAHGEKTLSLSKGRNSYFNQHMSSHGRI